VGLFLFLQSIEGIARTPIVGAQWLAMIEKKTQTQYLALVVEETVDCADLEGSDYPVRNGNWFYEPKLNASLIPGPLDVFCVKNCSESLVVVSYRFKQAMDRLKFDHEYLVFEDLEMS
jgi:hypothetical protein